MSNVWTPKVPFRVENVIINASKDAVTLVAEDGREVTITLEGDCCSQSTFDEDSIEEMRGLFAHTIRKMRDVCVGSVDYRYDGSPSTAKYSRETIIHPDLVPDPKFKGDSVSAHFLVIETDLGGYSIAWRNDSNGYYDGNPVWSGVDSSELDYEY